MENNLSDKLMSIKKKIDEAKTRKAQLEGKLEALMSELKSKYGVSTIEEADQKIVNLGNQIQLWEEEIEKGLKELSTKYGF